jgi:hypothetical protein
MAPDMSNFSGNVHGGLILKLLGQVAFTCAGHCAQIYVVTLPTPAGAWPARSPAAGPSHRLLAAVR